MKFIFRLYSNLVHLGVTFAHFNFFFPEARIVFYFGGDEYYSDYFTLEDYTEIVSHPAFKKEKPTVFYIHGYRESVQSESVKAVTNAYLKKNLHNIFALDWSPYAAGDYVTEAVPNTISLGRNLGFLVYGWMQLKILNNSQLHLVGHSLGAQLAGNIGKSVNFFSEMKLRIKRITGLDPAKPLFYTNFTSKITYIHETDADLVDIIHTNAGILGARISVGNCDFWPNEGFLQPGCSVKEQPACDHSRSWMYYAESVAKDLKFDAVHCTSYDDFKKLNCSYDTYDFMGFHATENCSGIYYLQTNSRPAYSRGILGTIYYPIVDSDRLTESAQ